MHHTHAGSCQVVLSRLLGNSANAASCFEPSAHSGRTSGPKLVALAESSCMGVYGRKSKPFRASEAERKIKAATVFQTTRTHDQIFARTPIICECLRRISWAPRQSIGMCNISPGLQLHFLRTKRTLNRAYAILQVPCLKVPIE